MIWLRRLSILFPISLVVFFGAAFVSVWVTPPKKLNQLIIGGIGEAKVLNPILYTTDSEGEVIGLIFRGLVKYDENINTVPDLAERWEISQASTLFFVSAEQAEQAERALAGQRERWTEWGLTGIKRDNARAILELSKAGTSYQETLLPVIEQFHPLPVSYVRCSLKEGAKLNGEPATSQGVLRPFDAEMKQSPKLAERLHSTFVNSSGQFDLVVVGDPAEFVELAKRLLNSANEKEALGQCDVAETIPVMNEPAIVFHLRSGVRWHDGKPLTARDVEFTFKSLLDEKIASPSRANYELVRSLEVLDDATVRVIYRKPYAPSLLSWSIGLLPRHILEGKDSQWWAAHFNRQPIGVGPYKFLEWRSNQYIRLRRNDDYWEGKPNLEFVTLRVIPDMVALRLSFETKEVDFWGVEPHVNQKYRHDQRYEVFETIGPQYDYVGWNLKRPLFQDARVRRALAHAVNVQQMIDFIRYGQGVQSTGPIPNGLWFANPNIKPYAYDPAQARALLAEAGWKPGPDGILQKDGKKFEFTLITNHPNEIRKDIATLVQSDLKKIGIKVDIQLYEWAVFISQYIDKQDFDACILGWSLGYDYDLYPLWHSSQAAPGMLNFCSYKNKEVDRLIELARSEFDEAKVKPLMWEIQRKIYEDQPYLFLEVPKTAGAMRPNDFRVKRPDAQGGWIDEPVRTTKLGFRVFQDWWYRPARKP